MFDETFISDWVDALIGIMLGFAVVVLIARSLWCAVKFWLKDDDE